MNSLFDRAGLSLYFRARVALFLRYGLTRVSLEGPGRSAKLLCSSLSNTNVSQPNVNIRTSV